MTYMGLENLMPGTSAFMANITQIFCRGPFCPVPPLPTARGRLAEISASLITKGHNYLCIHVRPKFGLKFSLKRRKKGNETLIK
jgi:hypothetical protein